MKLHISLPASRRLICLLPAIVLALSLFPATPRVALAANPPVQQTYYISLPEDDLLQLFDDNDDNADVTFPNPISPIRSITSIAIGSTGTWVYYDQWEDGGYDADITNPGANVYSTSNLDGTQIWGDGVLANGCPPSINNVANPCTSAANDQLSAGDVVILDNNVTIVGTTPGPYSRNAAQIFFDGRDKFGASFPVAVTRAAWPPTPGSVMAGANEVLDTTRWGTSYEAPLGENTSDSNTNAFEDVRWFIIAGAGGATIDVDANGDGDLVDANDLNDFVMAQGAKRQVNGILMGATLTVVSGSPVQVNSMTADVNDTFEFRWDALLPRSAWFNDYYTPVGTRPKANNSGCTEVEVYNPNATTITVNYDFPGGSSPDGSFTVAAGNTATGQTTPATPSVLYNDGGRYWTQGGEEFLPISVTDCTKDLSGTDGRLYDWGNPLFPVDQLTDQVLVGWAPGCSGDNPSLCIDSDIPYPYSRSVVWVTPTADTTLYVDFDGSGITCPAGADADLVVPATALTSYRFHDDPYGPNNVLDGFDSQIYSNNDGNRNWAGNWDEVGDGTDSPSGGDIQINTTSAELRFVETADANDEIKRSVDLTGHTTARLSFSIESANIGTTDGIRVRISPDGSTWTTLQDFTSNVGTAGTKMSYDISAYIGSATTVSFIMLDSLDSGNEYWAFDAVDIHYGDGRSQGDYDMTAARIRTCDGTPIAAAWGQNPAYSGSNDEEALDMGTGIAPLGSQIALDKSADKTQVAVGGPVNYTFEVINRGTVALTNITVTDNKCSPAVYSSGDDGDNILAPDGTETWIFTCTSNIFIDTTNVAYATGWTGTETIISAPDEWTVTVIEPVVIGNYVWLDEDGDGDQDAGEAGIPNVLVTLTGTDNQGNPVSLTTYTDANGGYLFDGLPPSNASGYTVTVTPPAGLHQTYDENGLGTPNATTVVITVAGTEHLTADFGYNWAPAVDTNNPPSGAIGAIGDRVWIDADGDGKQDLGEAGLGGVTVTLYHDPDGDGVYDTPYTVGGYTATRATDAAGYYIFDDLPAGAYAVEVTPPGGYNQTGDPDQYGATCTACDHKTTVPVILGPGDVYVNADFGYRPSGESSNIGDTVWLDADADGVQDTWEDGIAGVTVALILDDGDGVYEPGIDKIIATDITDENGLYLFEGLPAGTYFVEVTDTENVLGELAPTYDADGGLNERSWVTVNGVTDNLDQDFGYARPGQSTGEGMIGDTVWLDRDGGGDYDPGEGLEGVRVVLTDPGFDGILGTTDDTTRDTYTDENGNYHFGNLEPSLSYRITVDTTTLPAGVTNTIDPDGTTDSTAVVNLGAAGTDGVNDPDGLDNGINLGIDFAYRDLTNPNAIGGTLWEDRDADGTLDAGEGVRFEGVTVVLYDASGNVVATTTTDSNGNYSFTGLPDGTFTVDVTDDFNVLDGYWHSLGNQSVTSDGTSKIDPYTLSVAGGQTITTVDFGYYRDPALVGDFVWEDLDGDGIQDAGEPGIAGVQVKLTITYPNGNTTTLVTTTDVTGYYEFGNLLLDEDYYASNPPTAGQPAFTVSVDTAQPALAGWTPSPIDATPPEDVDSDNPDGEPVINLVQGLEQDEYDFGFRRPAAIGNKVWLDENGDGVQDPGEPGIANVTVELWDSNHTAIVATTVTDANGGYVFKNLLAGTYQVDVLNSTLPDPDGAGPGGLVQTFIPDGNGDFINHVDPYIVTVAPGQEDMTADFGYNWAPPADTDNPAQGALGAIGDRVWIDSDGDGVQDAEEMGLAGVTVELWYDSDNDGDIDAIWLVDTGNGPGVAVTNATGNYIFDQLPAGIYEVRVTGGTTNYTQTGDPDQLGVLCTACDAKTTTPVVLGPGDVFLNADFGYKPDNETFGTVIGDTIWFDADADGCGPTILGVTQPSGASCTPDNNEYGIPGVTVSLIEDLNSNKAWDPGEPIVATDITDANGQYLFTGVPPYGDYLVWVNDTDNVLGGLLPTYDSDGVATPNISAVTDLTPVGDLNQDFGYGPANQNPVRGVIGDTIFLDRDGGNDYDPGEGLEGVRVGLYDITGTILLATTVTDENGNYTFGNVPAGMYTVKVDTTTLPGGLINSVDPDTASPGDSQSIVTIGPGGVNLLQDFGYIGDGSIGNLVWNDVNADGVVDTGEAGIGGVTVDLYWDANGTGVLDAGDKLVGSTVTASDGSYSFTGLGTSDLAGAPNDINYFVHVSDEANVLEGYWHSLGTPKTDNNSQSDPYLVTLTTSQPTDNTADFGYYIEPAALGNFVWWDKDKDGIQDTGEPGIGGAEVVLTITWPDATTTVVKTVTASDGSYSFGNLLLDEDFDGAGSGEPVYSISVPNPPGYPERSVTDQGDDAADSDPNGVLATVTQGNVNEIYDFGFHQTPLGAALSHLAAEQTPEGVSVTWETVTEHNNAGFNLYRGETAGGPWALLNETLIATQAPGSSEGRVYTWVDDTVLPGVTYWYMLEDVALDGATTQHDPVSVTPDGEPNAVSLSGFGVAAPAAWPALAGLAAALGLAAAGIARRRK